MAERAGAEGVDVEVLVEGGGWEVLVVVVEVEEPNLAAMESVGGAGGGAVVVVADLEGRSSLFRSPLSRLTSLSPVSLPSLSRLPSSFLLSSLLLSSPRSLALSRP